jgi:hypothetical protein
MILSEHHFSKNKTRKNTRFSVIQLKLFGNVNHQIVKIKTRVLKSWICLILFETKGAIPGGTTQNTNITSTCISDYN